MSTLVMNRPAGAWRLAGRLSVAFLIALLVGLVGAGMDRALAYEPPMAQDDDLGMVNEGACITGDVVSNDFDADTDNLELFISGVEGGTYGAGSFYTSREVQYCSTAGSVASNTVDTFNYYVTDGTLESWGTVSVTIVNSPNDDPPTANADAATVAQGACVDIAVLANDTDPTGDALTVAITSDTTPATAEVLTDQRVRYCIAAGLVPDGTVLTFDYSATDPNFGYSYATVSVTVVAAPNRAPVAADDAVLTDSGTCREIHVLANDSDPDGDGLFVGSALAPGHGTAVINATSEFVTYCPAANFVGQDRFDYTVSDGEAADLGTVTVDVLNASPGVTDPADQTAVEGTSATFSLGSFADENGPWDIVVDWGDGTGTTTFTQAAVGSLGTRSHTFGADGDYAVKVTVVDATGGIGRGGFAVEVGNVTPNLRAATSQSASEGGSKSFYLGYFSDPGTDDNPWTVRVTWGDGTPVETFSSSGTVSGSSRALYRSHAFGADGTYTVAVTVTDSDAAASASRSFTVTVANVAPNLRAGTNQSTSEGAANSFYLGYFADPGTDDNPWTIRVTWGDGTAAETFSSAGTASGGFRALYRAHTYGADGTYTVAVTVTDSDAAASASRSFTATVRNVAPSLRPGTSQSTTEGGNPLLFLGYFTDPGTDDNPWTVNVGWGDGSTTETYTTAGSSVVGNLRLLYRNHVYGRDGVFTASVTVRDSDGAQSTQSFSVTVANVAPNLRAAGGQTTAEGSNPTIFLGFFTDPGTDDTPWSIQVTWGDGTAAESFTSTGVGSGAGRALYRTHTYGRDGSYTVTVKVTDSDAASSTKSFTMTVLNAAPNLRAGTSQSVPVATNRNLYLGYFSDPGTDDTSWTVRVVWGDGTAAETFTSSGVAVGGSRALYRTHTFAARGTYTVTVTVTDQDGGSSTKTFTVTVT